MKMNATYPSSQRNPITSSNRDTQRVSKATAQRKDNKGLFSWLGELGKELLAWSAAYGYMIAFIAFLGWLAAL
jgi:hypothetical protein